MGKIKVRFDKNVEYWNTYEGCGIKADGTMDTTSWGIDVSHLDGFISFKEGDNLQQLLVKYVSENLYTDLTQDYFLISDDGRVDMQLIEDNEGRHISTLKEEERLHDQGDQLFFCYYTITVEVHQEVFTPSFNQLKEMFNFQT